MSNAAGGSDGCHSGKKHAALRALARRAYLGLVTVAASKPAPDGARCEIEHIHRREDNDARDKDTKPY